MKLDIYSGETITKTITNISVISSELNQGLLVASCLIKPCTEYIQFQSDEFKLIFSDTSNNVLQTFNKVNFRRFDLTESGGNLAFLVLEV